MLLKMVNSASYAGAYGREIASIQTAISRIGLETTRNLALMSSIFSMFEGDESSSFDREVRFFFVAFREAPSWV